MSFLCRFQKDVIQAAHQRAKEMGTLRKSFQQGRGNYVGFIGEEVMRRYLTFVTGKHVEIADTFQYDVEVNGKTFEIKTSKQKSAPQSFYTNQLSAHNATQQADYYIFLRIVLDGAEEAGTAYFCGVVKTDEFRKKSTFTPKGTKMGNYTVQSSCYRCPISDCGKIWDLHRVLRADSTIQKKKRDFHSAQQTNKNTKPKVLTTAELLAICQ